MQRLQTLGGHMPIPPDQRRAIRTTKGQTEIFLHITGVPAGLVDKAKEICREEKRTGRKCNLSSVYANALVAYMDAVESGQQIPTRGQVSVGSKDAKRVSFWCREPIAERFFDFHDTHMIGNMSVLFITALERYMSHWEAPPPPLKRRKR